MFGLALIDTDGVAVAVFAFLGAGGHGAEHCNSNYNKHGKAKGDLKRMSMKENNKGGGWESYSLA
jgi:hypothetical protein